MQIEGGSQPQAAAMACFWGCFPSGQTDPCRFTLSSPKMLSGTEAALGNSPSCLQQQQAEGRVNEFARTATAGKAQPLLTTEEESGR